MQEETIFEAKQPHKSILQEFYTIRATTKGLWCGLTFLPFDNILDIFIKEQPITQTSRATVVQFSDENSADFYIFKEDDYPTLATDMKKAIDSGWCPKLAKCSHSDTVKWFMATSADLVIGSGGNPFLYGCGIKGPEYRDLERKTLFNSWGLTGKPGLVRLLSSSLNGLTLERLKTWLRSGKPGLKARSAFYEIEGKEERCLRAHDLQRAIIMSSLGFICDWLTFEEALSWSLVAGRKLQGLFSSWDEFMNHFLAGLGFFLAIDENGDSETVSLRKKTYARRHKFLDDPWALPWDTPLVRTWKSEAAPVNPQGSKLPEGFVRVPELLEGYPPVVADKFQKPLAQLAHFIEKGNRSVEEVEVVLHCVLHKALKLETSCAQRAPKLAKLAMNSFCGAAERIVHHYKIPLSVNAVRDLHSAQ